MIILPLDIRFFCAKMLSTTLAGCRIIGFQFYIAALCLKMFSLDLTSRLGSQIGTTESLKKSHHVVTLSFH